MVWIAKRVASVLKRRRVFSVLAEPVLSFSCAAVACALDVSEGSAAVDICNLTISTEMWYAPEEIVAGLCIVVPRVISEGKSVGERKTHFVYPGKSRVCGGISRIGISAKVTMSCSEIYDGLVGTVSLRGKIFVICLEVNLVLSQHCFCGINAAFPKPTHLSSFKLTSLRRYRLHQLDPQHCWTAVAEFRALVAARKTQARRRCRAVGYSDEELVLHHQNFPQLRLQLPVDA